MKPVLLAATSICIFASVSPAGTITGRVTRDTDGAPIAGIAVTAYEFEGSDYAGQAFTESDGYYRIENLTTGTYRVYTDQVGYLGEYYKVGDSQGYATPVSVVTGEETSGINFALTPEAKIHGHVARDSDGAPLEGIEVRALEFDSTDDYGGASARTDAAGNYAVNVHYGGTYRVRACTPPYSPGTPYVGEYYDNVYVREEATRVIVPGGAEVSGIDFRLDVFGSIRGRVTRESDGAPLEGIHVTAYYYETGASVRTAYTDANGLYVLDELRSDTYRVAAGRYSAYLKEYYDDVSDPDGALPVNVRFGQETSGIDFSLTLGGTITGRVTKQLDGSPVGGDWVHAYDFDRGGLMGSATARSDGYYVIDGLPAGTYRVSAGHAPGGYFVEYYNDVSSESEATPIAVTLGHETPDIDFSLTRMAIITGQVRGDSDGAPVGGIVIYVYDFDSSEWCDMATTNASGNYTIDGLYPGVYIVEADGWGSAYLGEYYEDASTPSEATPVTVAGAEEVIRIDFGLVRGGSISGRVTRNSDGAPVAGAEVNVFAADSYGGSETVTDENGYYLVVGLEAGTYYVEVDAFDYCIEYYDDASTREEARPVCVAVEAETSGIDVALVRPGSITGLVTRADGTPVQGVRVKIPDYYWYGDDTCTNGDGVYVIDGLDPGTYYLRLDAYGTPYPDQWYDGAYARTDATAVRVAGDHQTSGVDFVVAEVNTIRGTVVDKRTGRPIHNLRLDCWNEDLEFVRSAWTGPGGEYELTGMLPGKLILSAAPTSDMPYACIRQEVHLDDDLYGVDLALPRGATLSGKVVDPETGERVKSFGLDYWNGTYNMTCSYWMGGDGSFTLTNLPPGLARLNHGTPGFGTWSSPAGLIYLEEGQQVAGRAIALRRNIYVLGQVKDLAGRPVPWTQVDFYGRDCERGTRTGTDGFYVLTLPPGEYTGGVDFDSDDAGDEQWASLPVRMTIGDVEYFQAPDIVAYSRETGGRISGTVINSGGWGERTPYVVALEAGTVVAAETFATVSEICRAALSESGEFEIPILPPGSYDVYLTAEYYDADDVGSFVICDKAFDVPVGTADLALSAALPDGTLQGGVANLRGNAVLGANIFIADAGGAFVANAETGSGGQFQVENLAAGTYTLTAIHPKYQTTQATAAVGEGRATSLATIVMPFAGIKEATDLNGDAITDVADLSILADQWLTNRPDPIGATDFIDLADLARMADLWHSEAIWTLTGGVP